MAKDWKTRIYTGSCKHNDRTKEKAKREHIWGTAYCPVCEASRGIDGRWRVIEEKQ